MAQPCKSQTVGEMVAAEAMHKSSTPCIILHFPEGFPMGIQKRRYRSPRAVPPSIILVELIRSKLSTLQKFISDKIILPATLLVNKTAMVKLESNFRDEVRLLESKCFARLREEGEFRATSYYSPLLS